MAAVVSGIDSGTIVWSVPLRDVGAPGAGDGLYSLTGFTDTQLYSNVEGVPVDGQGQIGDENIPNLIDAAPPQTFTVGGPEAPAYSGR